MRLRVLLIWIVLLLVSCMTTPQPRDKVGDSRARTGLRLAPAELGASIALQQHLLIHRDGKTDELDTALEVDENRLQLVGLAFGQRILSLHYDGKNLTTWRHVMVPSQVREQEILEDLQLTLWPIESIRRALPPGWSIQDNGLERVVSLDDRIICQISYSEMPRWSGTVKLVNLRYHYDLTIQSQPDN